MNFVSDVSHEFKTPINAIEGYTMLLQRNTWLLYINVNNVGFYSSFISVLVDINSYNG